MSRSEIRRALGNVPHNVEVDTLDPQTNEDKSE